MCNRMEQLINDLKILIREYVGLSAYALLSDKEDVLNLWLGYKFLSFDRLEVILSEIETMARHEMYYSRCLREGKSIKTDIDNCANCKYYKLKTSGLIFDEDCKSLCHKRKE